MNILPDEDENLIATSARKFLEGECRPALVRAMEADALGYSPELWRGMAELGWLGICLPEQFGGSEMPLVHLGLLMREAGRVLAPVPFLSTATAALALARHGGEELKAKILPGVIAGETILTFAFQEDDARLLPAAMRMTAQVAGSDYILDGRKLYVDNFAAAGHVLVAARTGAGPQDVSLFLVDTQSQGISQRDLVTIAKDKQSEVTFQKVRVPRANLIGGWTAVADMLDIGTILLCAQIVGATRKDAEMAFEYAKLRQAFGQPIGAFQSVQHMCADMVIAIDGAEMLTFEALWKLDNKLPASVEISQAKSFCNDRCEAVVRNSQVIHGGIGFMMEFDLHLWFRRVSAWTMRLGTSYEHRARIAAALLDVPGTVVLGEPLPTAAQ